MRFQYCPHCGAKAVPREIGDEGLVPWCPQCQLPLFDMFSTCVITLVSNPKGEVALLRQSCISTQYRNLVSGYVQPGESAEEAAAREVQEELGLPVHSLRFAGTYWFGKKDMLMIGFLAQTDESQFRLSGEVERAQWADPEEALNMVHPAGSVSHSLVEAYLAQRKL